jgi:ketosteroid isomerase-like protein
LPSLFLSLSLRGQWKGLDSLFARWIIKHPATEAVNGSEGKKTMQTEESRRLVLAYYEALASGNPADLTQIVSDDVVWAPPASAPIDGPFRGRDIVLQAMAESGAQFFDMASLRMENRKVVADGDTVVVLQHLSGKTANGHDYSNEYVWVFSCAEGRIVRMDEHNDSLLFHRTMFPESD